MMEDENEQLDWGNEDDELTGEHGRSREYYKDVARGDDRSAQGYETLRRATNVDDTDDIVSLGGEEDDIQELVAFQSRSLQDPGGHVKVVSPAKGMPPPNQRSQRREASDSSQQQQRPKSSSKPSRQRSPPSPQLRRTQSQKIEVKHALPPKPVTTPAPFRAPNHSSIMEASTMADPMVRSQDEDKRRVNGSPSKPTSDTDDQGPLPPDWEMRRPRNQDSGGQIYYFNIRTEVSQWTRPTDSGKAVSPSSSRDKDRMPPPASYSYGKESVHKTATATQPERHSETRGGRRFDVPRQLSPVPRDAEASLGDRHYRSADVAQLPPSRRGADIRRDDRSPVHAHNHSSARQFFPESVSGSMKKNRLERDHSPQMPSIRQEVTVDRSIRSRRGSSPGSGTDNTGWRDSSRSASRVPQAALPEHWHDRRESTSRSTPALNEIQKPRHYNGARGESPSRMGRGYGERIHDIEGVAPSSSLRRDRSRSPLPHFHERDTPNAPAYQSSTAMGNRSSASEYPRSRHQEETRGRAGYDRPVSPTWNSPSQSRGDSNAYDHPPPRRPRESDPLYRNTVENDAKRRRTDDRNPDSAPTRRLPPRDESPPPAPSRHAATPSSFTSMEVDQSRPRKRPPLPPQSTRFKEMAPVAPPATVVKPSQPLPTLPRGPRDSGTEPRPANTNASIPSGPRHSIPLRPTVDINHVDPPYSRRPPPSGPSAQLSRSDGRRHSDVVPPPIPSYSANRDHDEMDIDTSPTSRYHAPRSAEGPRRGHEGMYADREKDDVKDTLPKGPRAMSARSNASVPMALQTSSSAQSSATFASEASYSTKRFGHEQEWKHRDRSPPPHTSKRPTRWGQANPTDERKEPDHRDGSNIQARREYSRPAEASGARETADLRDRYETKAMQPDFEQVIQDRRQSAPMPGKLWDEAPRSSHLPGPPHPSGPQITGSNNMPVPARKSWAVGGDERPAHPASLPSRPQFIPDRPAWDRSNSNVPTRQVPTPTVSMNRAAPAPDEKYPPPVEEFQRRTSISEQTTNASINHASSNGPAVRSSAQDTIAQSTIRDRPRGASLRTPTEPTGRVSRFSQPVQSATHSPMNVVNQPRTWIPRSQVPDDSGTAPSKQAPSEYRAPSLPSSNTVPTPASPSSRSSHIVEREHRQTSVQGRSRSRDKSPRGERPESRRPSPPPPPHYERRLSRASPEARDNYARPDGTAPTYRPPPIAPVRSTTPPAPQYGNRQYHRQSSPDLRGNRRSEEAREWEREQDRTEKDHAHERGRSDTLSSEPHAPMLQPSRSRMSNTSSNTPRPPSPPSQQPHSPLQRDDVETMPQRPSGPVRIRRPSTKFSDTPVPETTRAESGRDDSRDYGRQNMDASSSPLPQGSILPSAREHRTQRDRPGSTLLERLNMDPNPDPVGAPFPSLRERVEMPLQWDREEKAGSAMDVDYDAGYDDGDMSFGNGYAMGRGQKRRGKPRRGRGRGMPGDS